MRRLLTADAGMVVAVTAALVTSAVAITIVLQGQGVRALAAPTAIALVARPSPRGGARAPVPSPRVGSSIGPRRPAAIRRAQRPPRTSRRRLAIQIVVPSRVVTELGDLHDARGDGDRVGSATPVRVTTSPAQREPTSRPEAAPTLVPRSRTPRPSRPASGPDPADSASTDRADPTPDRGDPSAARANASPSPTDRATPEATTTSTETSNAKAAADSAPSPGRSDG